MTDDAHRAYVPDHPVPSTEMWRNDMGTRLAPAALAAITLACGGGGGGGAPSAATPAGPDYSGSWQGTTAHVNEFTGARNPIAFTVQGGQVTSLIVHLDLNNPPDSVDVPPGRQRGFCTYVFNSTAPAAIAGGAFTISIASTSGAFRYETSVKGTFQGATSAQGSIETVPVAAYACHGTVAVYSPPASDFQTNWTATK
jgi:hypothetical protein